MNYSLFDSSLSESVIALYAKVFTESEGKEAGDSIRGLATNLISTTKSSDLIGFVATENDEVVGCIFFSRLQVPSGETTFILSPVAVETRAHGTGIGQQLINFGLENLRSKEVSLVFTYGNPDYYSKTGFEPISETVVKAPYPLSQPIGWLAQSLNGETIQTMNGASKCVDAFNDPSYW